MKTTTNVFLDGLTTDTHPLTTKNNLLVDALNATLRTFNGNELMLLNDMGNTMILDSTTGNIMGLRDGYVPVGMKEYGGILYIASYNKETKEGQLGTIPSPLIYYMYDKDPYIKYLHTSDDSLTNTSLSSISLINNSDLKYNESSIQISDKRFQVGDLFIVTLVINDIDKKKTYRDIWETDTTTKSITQKTKCYNLLSGFNPDGSRTYGWFNLILEAKVDKSNDTIILSNVINSPQQYYLETELNQLNSGYWFINSDNTLDLDNERCLAACTYRTYPNILPGYLFVRIEPELPEDFEFFVNNSTGIKSPNIFIA